MAGRPWLRILERSIWTVNVSDEGWWVMVMK